MQLISLMGDILFKAQQIVENPAYVKQNQEMGDFAMDHWDMAAPILIGVAVLVISATLYKFIKSTFFTRR